MGVCIPTEPTQDIQSLCLRGDRDRGLEVEVFRIAVRGSDLPRIKPVGGSPEYSEYSGDPPTGLILGGSEQRRGSIEMVRRNGTFLRNVS